MSGDVGRYNTADDDNFTQVKSFNTYYVYNEWHVRASAFIRSGYLHTCVLNTFVLNTCIRYMCIFVKL